MLKKNSFPSLPWLAVAVLAATSADAAINLKKVNISEGNQVELIFDGKVDPAQMSREFVRDNIQLSFTNASVYPAKVSMVSGSDLTKVFAYQYSPLLVRARFTVKGDAAQYANRLQTKISGKSVIFRIGSGKAEQIPTSSASALRTVSTPEATAVAAVSDDADRKKLLDRVKDSMGEESERKTEKAGEKTSSKHALGKTQGSLTGGKPLPSPFRSIGVMLFVLGLFGLFVMFLNRMKKGDGKSAKATGGLGGFLTKLSGSSSGKAMIEVVATHALAPKRSIVVVRVQSRMLVLGMTNDTVNLITEFRANEDGDAEENVGLGDFAASLKKFETEAPVQGPTAKVSSRANLGDIAAAALGLAKPKPSSLPQATAAATAYQSTQAGSTGTDSTGAFPPALAAALKEPSVKPSIRAQIKDRVQGMKPL